MPPNFTDLVEEARLSARALLDYGESFFNPTVRLGVTGLSRAGKTVFITALIHGLTRGGRFPVFEALKSGRIARAELAPQPDDAVPRFDYENHLRTLIEERRWPHSTVDISELRLVIDYQRQNGADRTLTLDIVDYPGEWLLDLPLVNKSYEQWASRKSRAVTRDAACASCGGLAQAACDTRPTRKGRRAGDAPVGETVHGLSARLPRRALCHEPAAARPFPDAGRSRRLAGADFLAAQWPADGLAPEGSLWAMMARRYEAYKDVVVRPFFRDHFARLDRQIVLVDALAAFNAGPEAVRDLEGALAAILDCFRVGRAPLSSLFRPRIDRILFAATKADHLHHPSHERLEAVLRRAVERAARRRKRPGAPIDVVALAAVRATRKPRSGAAARSCRASSGVPMPRRDRGRRDVRRQHRGRDVSGRPAGRSRSDVQRRPSAGLPARRRRTPTSVSCACARRPWSRGRRHRTLPHIRLDRALQFLIGDRCHERASPPAGRVPARRSQVVVVTAEAGRPARGTVRVMVEPEPSLLAVPTSRSARRRRVCLGHAVLGALGGLVVLGIGLGVTQLIEDLFARSEELGWLGVALGVAAALAFGRDRAARD